MPDDSLVKLKVSNSLTRAAYLTIETVGERTTKRVSIASDVPYLREDWDGTQYFEVLGHGPGDIDETRLKLGLSALYNHRRDDLIGRATKYNNDGHRLDVGTLDDIIWSESDFAKTKRRDIESGALVGTSVGYEILDEGTKIGTKEGVPVYKFRWSPHEFSFCTIEADTTVGAGRSRSEKDQNEGFREISVKNTIDGEAVTKDNASEMKPNAAPDARTFRNKDEGGGGSTASIDATAERNAAVVEFKARCKKIDAHVAAIRSDKWREIVTIVANKHKDGEADYEAFRTEANNAIDAYTSAQHRGEGDAASGVPSGIQVIGERGQPQHQRNQVSVGRAFVDAKGFRDAMQFSGQGERKFSMDFKDVHCLGGRGKAQLASRAGWTSSDLSAINVAPMATLANTQLGVQRTTIMDLISPGTTDKAAIPYPVENSLGSVNGVAVTAGTMPRVGTTAEGATKPRWTPDLTTATANVQKVAVVTSVPDEFLSDFSAFGSYIDARLPYMVDIEAEFQLLYGDGAGTNIRGILSSSGVQTRAFATDWFTTIKKAITDIRVNSFFEPDGIAMHPYDWEVASLEKDLNGQPLAGGPFYLPYGQGVYVERYTYNGLPVAVTTSVTATRPVVGAWKLGAQYFLREGMRIETTNANKDDFERNLVSLRAEERLALAVYRPVAFLEITGGTVRT
jgi:HK97 family phage major capsid protein